MDYISILNMILNQIGTPFNLSVFCNGSTLSVVIDKEISTEVLENLRSQLFQLVSKVCLEYRETQGKLYINVEH